MSGFLLSQSTVTHCTNPPTWSRLRLSLFPLSPAPVSYGAKEDAVTQARRWRVMFRAAAFEVTFRLGGLPECFRIHY